MSNEASSSKPIETLTKLVTLLSLGLAAFAAWKALPIDTEIKRLQAETHRLDLALKQADSDLKGLESSRKITMELYQEVKKVIEKKDKSQKEEDVVRVLVESLADDPFRWKLLQLISIGANSEDVKGSAAATATFYKEQAQIPSAPQLPEKLPASSIAGSFNVDFFYCESTKAITEPIARKAHTLQTSADTGVWRVRALPESINQQPGYSIRNNIIRFTPPDERKVAETLRQALGATGIKVSLQEVSYSTPGYVSVFICQ